MTHRQLTTAVAALLVLAAVAPGVAVAQTDDEGIIDGIDGPSDLVSVAAEGVGAITDAVAGGLAVAEHAVLGDDRTPAEQADATAATFNSNSDSIETYLNARVSDDVNRSAWDVIAVEVVGEEETATRYLTADVVDGNFTNLSMDASTDRTVDKTIRLEGAAAANADGELDYFVTEYVDEDRDPDAALRARWFSFRGDVTLPDGVL